MKRNGMERMKRNETNEIKPNETEWNEMEWNGTKRNKTERKDTKYWRYVATTKNATEPLPRYVVYTATSIPYLISKDP